MSVNPFKYVWVHATFSEVFGVKYDKDRIIDLIKPLPWGGILNVASQMLSHPPDDKVVRQKFVAYLKTKNTDHRVLELINTGLEHRVLTFPQGLLAVCKWLLAYGSPENYRRPVDLDFAISMAAYLCLAISDHLDNSETTTESIPYKAAQLWAFGESIDLPSAIARSYYVYGRLAKDTSRYASGEYVDFNKTFEDTYGYGLVDMLSVIFAVQVAFGIGPHPLGPDWVKDVDELFALTKIEERSKQIIRDQLWLTVDEARRWAQETVSAPYDLTLFQRKPLLELQPNRSFFPIAPRFLEEQLFSGLYHRVRRCYSQTDTRFITFFGRPFEEYVKELVAEAATASRLPYEVLPEFTYGKGGMKRSPEALIKLGNRLLAIEVKAQRMQLGGLIQGDRSVIDHDHFRMVTKPLKQARDRVDELTALCTSLKDIESVHLMVVTMGGFPTFKPFEDVSWRDVTVNNKLPIKGLHHLDIEEFEMFCYHLTRGRPIFRLLDNKSRLGSNMSLKNYLLATSQPTRRPSFVDRNLNAAFEDIRAMFFPAPELPKD